MKPHSSLMPVSFWLILAPAFFAYAATAPRFEYFIAVAITLLGNRLSNTEYLLKEERVYFRLAARHLPTALAVAIFLFGFYYPLIPFSTTFLLLVLIPSIGIAAFSDELRSIRAAITFISLFATCMLQAYIAEGFPPFGIEQISQVATFTAILCICRSNCFLNEQESYTPEFCLSLLIALITSFALDSWVFAALLAFLPTLGFCIRNHKRSRRVELYYSTELEDEDESLEDLEVLKRRPSFRMRAVIGLLACSVAITSVLGYLFLMESPSWTQFIGNNNYHLSEFGKKLDRISAAASLDSHQLRESIKDETREKLLSVFPLEEKEEAPTPALLPLPEIDRSTLEIDIPTPPPITFDTSEETQGPAIPTEIESTSEKETLTVEASTESPSASPAPAPSDSETLTRSERFQEMWENAGEGSLESDLDLRSELSLNVRDRSIGDEQLDLENPRFSSTRTDLLFIAKAEGRINPGPTLYLRTQTLDTVTRNGFSSSTWLNPTIPLVVRNNKAVRPKEFMPDRNSKASLKILSFANIASYLPVPRDYQSIEIEGVRKIHFDSDDFTLRPSPGPQIRNYTIHGVQFPTTSKLKISPSSRRALRRELTSLPLSEDEKAFLSELAIDITGKNPSISKLSRRLKAYFQKNHPYSFDLALPAGNRHAAVRWLESESPGICSNFASAFTLLARSQGIPTRLVTGYASSEYDRKKKAYIIRSRNAHAWVEMLDDSNRWIRVDPTAIPDQNFLQNQIASATELSEPSSQSASGNSQGSAQATRNEPIASADDLEATTEGNSSSVITDEEEAKVYELSELDAASSTEDLSLRVPSSINDFDTPIASNQADSKESEPYSESPPVSNTASNEIEAFSEETERPETLNEVMEDFLREEPLDPNDTASTPIPENLTELPPASTEPVTESPLISEQVKAIEPVVEFIEAEPATIAPPAPNPLPEEPSLLEETAETSPRSKDTEAETISPQPTEQPSTSPLLNQERATQSVEAPTQPISEALPVSEESLPPIQDAQPSTALPKSYYIAPLLHSPLFLLLALAAVVLALPSFRVASNIARTVSQPQELKLRAKAGRLLTKVEQLISEFRLHEENQWTELRNALIDQRYSPRITPNQVNQLSRRITQLRKAINQ